MAAMELINNHYTPFSWSNWIMKTKWKVIKWSLMALIHHFISDDLWFIYMFFQSEHIVAFLFSLARGLDLRYFIYFRVYCGNSNFFVNVIAPSEPINHLLKISQISWCPPRLQVRLPEHEISHVSNYLAHPHSTNNPTSKPHSAN